MQVARRKGGGGKGRRPKRRRLPVNPFGQVGSPIQDLISSAEWDRRYDGIKADLMEAAKVGPGSIEPGSRPVSRQCWFAANVESTVKGWLELAGQPAVREVKEEHGELYIRLWDALTLKTLEAVAAAADAYEALSPPARDALRGRDRPSPEAIRDGDGAALQLLFGLVPIALGASLDVHQLFAAGAEYLGPGSDELHLPGRPRDVRIEQLIDWLAIIYELATDRRPTLGVSSPFAAFIGLLLSILSDRDLSERGHRAVRRAVKWRKSRIFRDNRTK